jgi:hypothetical protein
MASTTTNWGERTFNRPTAIQARLNSGPVEASSLRPFRRHQDLAVVGDHAVVASVPCLFCTRRPPAVFGRVGTVVVDSFEREPRSVVGVHVGGEVVEGPPAFRDGNTPAAVVFPALIARVFAPVPHVGPHPVEPRAEQGSGERGMDLDRTGVFSSRVGFLAQRAGFAVPSATPLRGRYMPGLHPAHLSILPACRAPNGHTQIGHTAKCGRTQKRS